MIKEILEGPSALERTIEKEHNRIHDLAKEIISQRDEMIYITGIGTRYNAGLAVNIGKA